MSDFQNLTRIFHCSSGTLGGCFFKLQSTGIFGKKYFDFNQTFITPPTWAYDF